MKVSAFTKRNILLYFRDKTTVFFSLLSVLILIGLYVVFLGDLIIENIPDFPEKNSLFITWFIAGIMAIGSLTTTLGSFGIFVEDRARRTIMDFYSSPISRAKLLSGYILSALFVGIIMCLIIFIISYLYLIFIAKVYITFYQIVQLFIIIILSVLVSASMVLFIVSFLKTLNAFAAVSMITGTLIGFLAGIYIPVGNFPAYIQAIIKIFPISHTAALFRQVLMNDLISNSFQGAPVGLMDEFKLNMGIQYEVGSIVIPNMTSIVYLLMVTIIFFALSLRNIQKNT